MSTKGNLILQERLPIHEMNWGFRNPVESFKQYKQTISIDLEIMHMTLI